MSYILNIGVLAIYNKYRCPIIIMKRCQENLNHDYIEVDSFPIGPSATSSIWQRLIWGYYLYINNTFLEMTTGKTMNLWHMAHRSLSFFLSNQKITCKSIIPSKTQYCQGSKFNNYVGMYRTNDRTCMHLYIGHLFIIYYNYIGHLFTI